MMAVFGIPTSTTLPYYQLEVELDGVVYRLRFKFNERDEAWYLDFLDLEDNFLRAGLRVVNDWTLLRLWQLASAPAGEMIAVSDEQQTTVAQIDELGKSVILTYLGGS